MCRLQINLNIMFVMVGSKVYVCWLQGILYRDISMLFGSMIGECMEALKHAPLQLISVKF